MRIEDGPGTPHIERLAHDLFRDVPDDDLAQEVARWLAGSRRFRSFAATNRAKIHKKLRGAVDVAARADVRAELLVAHLLLAEPRFDLAFEAHGSGKAGPDFTVAMRGARGFDLEVTRSRTPLALGGVLLTKLRQLLPGVPNLLVIALPVDGPEAPDLAKVVRDLRARADRKDDAFFSARGFDGARGFYDRFLRLGAVIVWREAAEGDRRAAVWINPSARIALPDRAVRACVGALRRDPAVRV